MYTHKNMLPIKIASKNSIKHELRSVAFYGDRTIATDSFRLLEVSATGDKHEVQVIEANVLKKVKKELKNYTKFQLPEIEVAVGVGGNPDVSYPDVDKIMQEKPDVQYASVKINGDLLGELLMVMSKMNRFGMVELKIPIDAQYTPVHIYASDSDGQKAHGLCMPINRQ